MDHAGPPGGPNGSLTAKERRDWVGVIVPEPTPPSSDRWPSRPTHKRPIPLAQGVVDKGKRKEKDKAYPTSVVGYTGVLYVSVSDVPLEARLG